MEQFSVLMSVYIKEKVEYFNECVESVLNQTITPSEIVIVKDGPISDEINNSIDEYIKKNPKLFNIVELEKNMGLGLALAEGIKHCKYELIARMDTDDICVNNRFEKQLKEFENNKNLDICGTYIKEFEGNISNYVSERKVPLEHKDIAEYQKTRSAVNHVSVMFKKSAVLRAGNYQDAPLMEDDVLWVNMLLTESQFMNIPESLVYVRVGNDMIKRRGSLSYLKKYINGRKTILKTGYISYWQYLKTVLVQTIVALIPNDFRKIVFTKLLRK